MDLPLKMGQLPFDGFPQWLRDGEDVIVEDRAHSRQAGYEEGVFIPEVIARGIVHAKRPDAVG